MQRGIEKNRGVGIGIDMRIGRKKKCLEKLKSFIGFGLYPIERPRQKILFVETREFPSWRALRRRGVVKISRLYLLLRLSSLSLSLSFFFFRPFSLLNWIRFIRGVCCHPEMEGKKNEGDEINESNSRTICRVYLCFYFCVCMCVCVCVCV